MTQRGFTLIELLISITIVVIVATIALPSFNAIFKRHEANRVADTLQLLIHSGRNYALSRHRNITLCGSSDGRRCDAVWAKQILMLEDDNRNGVIDGADRIVQSVPLNIQPSKLVWRGFGGNKITIGSVGTSFASNGTFTYCRQDQDPLYRRQVIINRGGRARKSMDRNKDGIDEDSNGDPIKCL